MTLHGRGGSLQWEVSDQADQYGCHTARVAFSDIETGAHIFEGMSRSRSKALAFALEQAAMFIMEQSKSTRPDDIMQELER